MSALTGSSQGDCVPGSVRRHVERGDDLGRVDWRTWSIVPRCWRSCDQHVAVDNRMEFLTLLCATWALE
jgi:hypothetical protein